MREPTGRETARGDLLLFAGCVALALLALVMPRSWAASLSAAIRETALRPVIALQTRATQDRTSRFRLSALQRTRDSLALLVQGDDALREENNNLRALIGMGPRLQQHHVAAEVLHRPATTDSRMLLLSAGTLEGVKTFDPVVTADGLLGQIWSAGPHASTALTWTHPDFSASAVTADGKVRGFIVPTGATASGLTVLELRGVALRDSLPIGTVVYTSGEGGVYPRGIGIGRVTAIGREELGYERIYRVIPFANPGDATHVMVLTGPPDSSGRGTAPGTEPRMTAPRIPERRRRQRASDRIRVVLVILILLALEFYLRPSLIEGRWIPDFLLLALMLLAIRQRPGGGAITGLIVGLVIDVLTPARFGAAILAHVLVGWGAAWGRAVFFADNLLVNAALFFFGTWFRNALVLLLSGVSLQRFAVEALLWSPLQGLTTAMVGVAVVLLFRDWLAIRIDA